MWGWLRELIRGLFEALFPFLREAANESPKIETGSRNPDRTSRLADRVRSYKDNRSSTGGTDSDS